MAYYQSFLSRYEGFEDLDGDITETEQLLVEIELDNEEQNEVYLIYFGEVNGPETVAILNDHSVLYVLTKDDMFSILQTLPS